LVLRSWSSVTRPLSSVTWHTLACRKVEVETVGELVSFSFASTFAFAFTFALACHKQLTSGFIIPGTL
jgi:hypothetical protein